MTKKEVRAKLYGFLKEKGIEMTQVDHKAIKAIFKEYEEAESEIKPEIKREPKKQPKEPEGKWRSYPENRFK